MGIRALLFCVRFLGFTGTMLHITFDSAFGDHKKLLDFQGAVAMRVGCARDRNCAIFCFKHDGNYQSATGS